MNLRARLVPCRCPQKTRRRYERTRYVQSFLVPRKSGSSSETYFSVASRTTHARETLFFLAILSRETYVSEGSVTDNRRDCSLLGAALELVFSCICTTLHHNGAGQRDLLRISLRLAPI